MQDYFGYGVYENSLVYMAGGLEALIVFFGVAFVSRWVRDTTLQLVGWFLMLAAQIWLLVVIPQFERGKMAKSNPLLLPSNDYSWWPLVYRKSNASHLLYAGHRRALFGLPNRIRR